MGQGLWGPRRTAMGVARSRSGPLRGAAPRPPPLPVLTGGLVSPLCSLCAVGTRDLLGPSPCRPQARPPPVSPDPLTLQRGGDWFLAHCPLPWMDGHKGDAKLGAPRAGPASVNAARPVATDGPAGRPLGAEPSWPLRGAAVCCSLGRGRSCWTPRAEGREDQEPPQGPGLPPSSSGADCLSVWQEHRGGATTCRSSGLFLGGPLFLPSRPPFSRDLLRPSGGGGASEGLTQLSSLNP